MKTVSDVISELLDSDDNKKEVTNYLASSDAEHLIVDAASCGCTKLMEVLFDNFTIGYETISLCLDNSRDVKTKMFMIYLVMDRNGRETSLSSSCSVDEIAESIKQ